MSKLTHKKIVLDVDSVLADFIAGILREAKARGLENEFPKCADEITHWDICPRFYEVFSEVRVDDNFWLNLPLVKDTKVDFTPYRYLTARVCDSKVTREWINKVGLPDAEVLTVRNPLDKIEILLDLKPDLFVDDHWQTIIEARKAGINAVLFKQPYQVGHPECKELPTIESLSEIKEILK